MHGWESKCFATRCFEIKTYVESLSSRAHSIPFIERVIGKGGGRNQSFTTFKYDDWKAKQHFSSKHFTICKQHWDWRTWDAFYSSDFSTLRVAASSSTNSATTGWSSITRFDYIFASRRPACSKFFISSFSSMVTLRVLTIRITSLRRGS